MRKIIIRADDVGYTDVCNIGTFETIYNGVVTSADVMLESPGTVDALMRLKELPWISVGWHAHFWCSPVLPVEQVPSLVIPGTNRFRHDLKTADDFDDNEFLNECRAQMNRCLEILGRVPDTAEYGNDSKFDRLRRQICDEYGIVYGFAKKEGRDGVREADPKWANRKIYIPAPRNAYKGIVNERVEDQFNDYDPASYYLEDKDGILQLPEDVITEQSWHPGYVDYYVYKCGDYGPAAKFFTGVRTADVEALTSERLKQWIKDNNIELINFRDALYGTKEYQNHLRVTNSDLYMEEE